MVKLGSTTVLCGIKAVSLKDYCVEKTDKTPVCFILESLLYA